MVDNIRETIWYRTKFEDKMVASNEALRYHWTRSCWIRKQADVNEVTLEPITQHGLKFDNGLFTIEWDSTDNIVNKRESAHPYERVQMCFWMHYQEVQLHEKGAAMFSRV